MNTAATLTLSDRLALILDGLGKAVAARIAPGMAGWVMQAAVIGLVWTRIRRIEGTLQGLLARFQAGRLRVRAGAGPAPRGGGGRSGSAKAGQAKLPRRFGWLIGLVPYQAAGYASQLRHQLGDPEMQALLRASPQARRVMRSLGWMLAIEADLLTPRDVTPPDTESEPDARREEPYRAGLFGQDPASKASSEFPPRSAGRLQRPFPPGAG